MEKIHDLNKKSLCFLFVICLFLWGNIFIWSQEPTPVPDAQGIGTLYFVPQDKVHTMLDLQYYDNGIPPLPSIPITIIGPYTFNTEVHFNSGNDILAAYSFLITFNSSVVVVNTNEGTDGVSPGTEGFVVAVNTDTPGEIVASGFDVNGTGPGTDLHLLTIHWLAQTYDGTTIVHLTPDIMTDPDTATIGSPATVDGTITIQTETCVLRGDINNDGTVNIVDALLVAQWYVGLNPSGVDIVCGDVDHSGSITILDALLIAQYFVGLITTFP